jgi:hypothetical protein
VPRRRVRGARWARAAGLLRYGFASSVLEGGSLASVPILGFEVLRVEVAVPDVRVTALDSSKELAVPFRLCRSV